MLRIPKQFLPFTAALTLLILLVGSLGMLGAGIHMQPDRHMSGCPFTAENALCSMSPLEHIAAWQSAFSTNLPAEGMALVLLLLISVVLLLGVWGRIRTPDIHPPASRARIRFRERTFFRDPLQEAFSNGILHPKIF